MNPTTQQVIEFLSHPELPFGAEEDLLLLADPLALRERVAALLEESPRVLGAAESQALAPQLDEADWPFIAREFRARIQVASGFFEVDTDEPAKPPADAPPTST